MLWHSEVIDDFVKRIFSLIQEDSHFLAKTDLKRHVLHCYYMHVCIHPVLACNYS